MATDGNKLNANTSRSLKQKNPEDVVSDSSKNVSISRSRSFLRLSSNTISGTKEHLVKKEVKNRGGPLKPQ